MEENKFNQQDQTGGDSGMPNAAPRENVETATPASQNMSGQGTQDPTGPAGAQETKSSSMLPIIGGVVALLILGALAYFFLGGGENPLMNSNGGSADVNMQNEAGAGVSFDLDTVVARVNGTELLGSDLAYQMVQAAQQAGVQDLSTLDDQTMAQVRQQSLNAIVNTELLVQAAREEGLTVSDEEVETEYQSIVESVGGQDVADERFEALGITEAEFRENLADDLIILDYIDAQGEADALAVSEEEIQAFYDEVTQGQSEGTPPLEEVRGQIEEQLQFQKEQEVLSSVIDELRQAADIELLL